MISIGVIGCGHWGPNHIRVFSQLPNSKCSMCADIDEARLKSLKALFPSIELTRDHQDILKNPEITGVVIATNLSTHYAIAKDALNAGKHILLEKPVAASVKESEELVKLAKSKKQIARHFCRLLSALI